MEEGKSGGSKTTLAVQDELFRSVYSIGTNRQTGQQGSKKNKRHQQYVVLNV
jgi:hypothetical protein